MTALDILQKYWNHTHFRKSQREIIDTVLQKKNVVALLPTGGGKSVCYQIPTLLSNGVCVVVSPLIALMHDQVNGLKKKGIKAIAITSKLTETEIIIAFDNLQFGNYKFLYVSPEKLQSTFIQEKIKQLTVSLIAIDEAHCISEWGHDFRPSYLQINSLIALLPNTPIIALTATATSQVTEDIINLTPLTNPVVFKETFKRTNLAYQVFKTEDIYHQLQRIFNKIKAPSIIYVSSRKKTKDISDLLNSLGYKSTYYHGGLSSYYKEKSFNKWMNEESQIMVATNAFGMGIDKGNVKVVIHIDIPNSIENYVQEAGRAGRNGKKAFSVVLYNNATLHEFKKKITNSITTIDDIKKVYQKLNQHLFISKGEIPEKSFPFNLQDFCAKYKLNVFKTYNALQLLEKEAILVYEQHINKQSNILFKTGNEHVLKYSNNHRELKTIIQLLLRTYGGVFEVNTPINEAVLAKKLNVTKRKIIRLLNKIAKDKIIQYNQHNNDSQLHFLVMREDQITMNHISKNINKRNQIKLNKSQKIIDYITSKKVCRNIQLGKYFNETMIENCGICDICLTQKKETLSIEQTIIKIKTLLENYDELSSKKMILLLKIKEQLLIDSLQFLLENNQIKLTNSNNYKIVKQ